MRPSQLVMPLLVALVLALAPARAAPGTDVTARAEALLLQDALIPAVILLQEHLAEHPEDVAAHELLIDVMASTGNPERAAERYLQQALAAPNSADAWYLAGRADPTPEGSEEKYARALSLNPKHPRALMGAGAMHRLRGRYPEATEAYGEALALDPTLAEAWSGLAEIAVARRDSAGARAVLERAVVAAPGDSHLWLRLSSLDPGRARSILQRGVKAAPADPRLHAELARTAWLDRDWAAASSAYGAALQILPGDPALRVEAELVDEILRGLLSPEGADELLDVRASNDVGPAALERVSAVVRANPGSGWARLVRGHLHVAAKDSPHAEEDLRKALDRMPANADAQQALGIFLLSHNRPDLARPLLLSAAGNRPADDALIVAAAVASAQAGDVRTALLELEAAVAAFPTSEGPPLALARLLLGVDGAQEAYTVLARAVERSPTEAVVAAFLRTAIAAERTGDGAVHLRALGQRLGQDQLIKAAETLAGR